MRRKLLATATATAVAAAAGGLFAAPTSAHAMTSYAGCDWPYVCFYLHETDWDAQLPTAKYKDITNDFQTLGSRSRNAAWFVNSRNDDGALLRFADGTELCLIPNSVVRATDFGSGEWHTATGVMISDDAYCNGRGARSWE